MTPLSQRLTEAERREAETLYGPSWAAIVDLVAKAGQVHYDAMTRGFHLVADASPASDDRLAGSPVVGTRRGDLLPGVERKPTRATIPGTFVERMLRSLATVPSRIRGRRETGLRQRPSRDISEPMRRHARYLAALGAVAHIESLAGTSRSLQAASQRTPSPSAAHRTGRTGAAQPLVGVRASRLRSAC